VGCGVVACRDKSMTKIFHVYILASQSGVLYTGVTGNLERRIRQHRGKENRGFTGKYNVKKLVWFEAHGNARSAIAREKEIKGWLRAKKIALIEAGNPQWEDLSGHLRL
jgi:putative endonuclease